jgi:hypothetical protein
MDTQFLRALQTQILADAECAPHVHTNDMPRISSEEVRVKDAAVAQIISGKRTRLVSKTVTERGVRAAMSIMDGSLFIKTLRELSEATTAPAWLTTVLTAMGVPGPAQWAYFETLQCGYPWLRADGLDVGEPTVRQLLDLLAAGVPSLGAATVQLKSLGVVPDPVTADQVSRAVRGPWGDE